MAGAKWRSTTIIAVRRDGKVAMAGDGQVTFGETVIKDSANKIRTLRKGSVIAGFAGSAADAFALLEKFEGKLEEYSGDLVRASVQLAKEWRTDKILRQLEAMIVVADKKSTLVISGNGNVLEPENDVAAIGSGGQYARAAALALMRSGVKLSAMDIARDSLKIASEICIYTNSNIQVEEISE
ncbi:MAG: HslU--HslV peptidase proteolytic subunit [Spirochaetes bacterium GWF1_49_6]|jgi:ATP-dependent HslUV protease subunit HslV|nr:MAG: HslU--HslV peptidase proteolytic subunit [Spirochaetes bacterium GWF1_49_6]HAX36565.1 HslU--HslV peptidase proteolytic subunit [Spirochaetaceae bacterium]